MASGEESDDLFEVIEQPVLARAKSPGRVGTLSSASTLDSVEASLSIPAETGNAQLLSSLQGTLSRSARNLRLPKLSAEQAAEIRQAQLATTLPKLQGHLLACDGITIENIPVDRAAFARLRTSRHRRDYNLPADALYLNDEVVNAWAKCVSLSGFKVQVFSTMFVAALWRYRLKPTTVEYLRRQLSRLDKEREESLLDLDAWVLPRHHGGNHWTGALISFKSKQVVFADSMGSKDTHFCRRLWCMLEVASQVFWQRPFDFQGWTWGSLGQLAPQQPTAYDCGIFATMLLVSALAYQTCVLLHCN